MITFDVNDMTCGHCASAITQAVNAVDKDAGVRIDLRTRQVQIDPVEAHADELLKAIQEAGYTPRIGAQGIKAPASS